VFIVLSDELTVCKLDAFLFLKHKQMYSILLQRTGPPGVFIVLSGLVKVELLRCKQHSSYFVGVGGSVGYLSSLLGRDLPGVALVAAFAQVG
jgi:hypothetical protein